MKTVSKTFLARAALGLVALAGVAAALPADARPFDGRGGWDRGYDRGRIERVYAPVVYGGYHREFRPVRIYAPAPVVVWHRHFDRW